MMLLNCPYCNENIPHADAKMPWFESPCCKKIVKCTDASEPKFALHSVNDSFMLTNRIGGDNTGHSKLMFDKAHKRTTEPRWAHVYSSGLLWYVRIAPPVDLDDHGRAHGVSLGNEYTTRAEANRFADSMERYFGDAEKRLGVPEEETE